MNRYPWLNTAGLNAETVRVCFRRGTARWPGYEHHVLAFFAEGIDRDSGMIAVWDLETGDTFEAPIHTMSQRYRWTEYLDTDETDEARRELETKIGAKVATLKHMKGV